jgi:hypothetical protein
VGIIGRLIRVQPPLTQEGLQNFFVIRAQTPFAGSIVPEATDLLFEAVESRG